MPPAPPFATEGAARCQATARHSPPSRALAMAASALREHAVWGGQTLDGQGRLIRSGSSEAEDAPRPFLGLAPWERVLRYWNAVDPQERRLPYVVRHGALERADRARLLAEIDRAAQAPVPAAGAGADSPAPLQAGPAAQPPPGSEPPLRFASESPSWSASEPSSSGSALSPGAARALAVVVDRVAVVDTPWSAAFVSWLAREAGLAEDEFTFSEAHADYAASAWMTTLGEQMGLSTSYALRACDLASTTPRVGDVACLARGSRSDLDTFDRLGAALEARRADGGALPMHCEVVVRVDANSFDTVGGNVLQSVTLRRLDFAPGTQLLDPGYQPAGCSAGKPDCVDRHMSRDPWVLLLQWR